VKSRPGRGEKNEPGWDAFLSTQGENGTEKRKKGLDQDPGSEAGRAKSKSIRGQGGKKEVPALLIEPLEGRLEKMRSFDIGEESRTDPAQE